MARKAKMRAEQVSWLIKTHLDFSLKEETFLLSLNLFDRSLDRVRGTAWQLVAVACMRVASKYEEILINELGDFQRVTGGRFTKQQINHAELQVIEAVGFAISQTCHTTVIERLRLLLGLDDAFPLVTLYLLKAALVDVQLAGENQYLLAVAIGTMVADRVFQKPAGEAIFKSMFVVQAHVVKFWGLLQQAVRNSILDTLNPARRDLIQHFGTGPVKKMEDLLLQ